MRRNRTLILWTLFIAFLMTLFPPVYTPVHGRGYSAVAATSGYGFIFAGPLTGSHLNFDQLLAQYLLIIFAAGWLATRRVAKPEGQTWWERNCPTIFRGGRKPQPYSDGKPAISPPIAAIRVARTSAPTKAQPPADKINAPLPKPRFLMSRWWFLAALVLSAYMAKRGFQPVPQNATSAPEALGRLTGAFLLYSGLSLMAARLAWAASGSRRAASVAFYLMLIVVPSLNCLGWVISADLAPPKERSLSNNAGVVQMSPLSHVQAKSQTRTPRSLDPLDILPSPAQPTDIFDALAAVHHFREKWPKYNYMDDVTLAEHLAAKYPAYTEMAGVLRATEVLRTTDDPLNAK